jgi:hypothetical protein
MALPEILGEIRRAKNIKADLLDLKSLEEA